MTGRRGYHSGSRKFHISGGSAICVSASQTVLIALLTSLRGIQAAGIILQVGIPVLQNAERRVLRRATLASLLVPQDALDLLADRVQLVLVVGLVPLQAHDGEADAGRLQLLDVLRRVRALHQ